MREDNGMSVTEAIAVSRLRFDGALLHRGFWLYVWRIRQGDRLFIYVGRTASESRDFSAPKRSSPITVNERKASIPPPWRLRRSTF